MSTRVNVSLDYSDYGIYSDNPASANLTEKQMAILYSVAILLIDRRAWATVTDSEWDEIDNEINDILTEVNQQ